MSEKVLQDASTFVLKNPAEDDGAVVEARIIRDLIQRVARTGLQIRGSIDHGGDSSLDDGTRAHWTGFQGAVQRTVEQSP